MTKPSESSEINSGSTESTVHHTNHESYTATMATHKLDGKNYLQWSKSIQMIIAGRGKFGYLTGTTEKPEESAATYQTWFENDNLVRSWLLASMQPSIGENYLLHQSAKDVWDDAKDTYSTTDNSSALFEVEARLYNLKQGDMDSTEFFNHLYRSWLHLDMYEAQPWETAKDSALFKRFIEKKRTIQFLLGLNPELDDVKGRVMGKKPFPSLKEAFAEVRREEHRRHLMLPEVKTQEESSAMAAYDQFRNNRFGKNKQPSDQGKNTLFCDHCKKPYHTKSQCWEIVGKPADWKPRSERKYKANAVTTIGSSSMEKEGSGLMFSKDQMEQLKLMFEKLGSSGQSSTENHTGLFTKQGGGIGEDDWQY
ncbi:hypothetical protein LINPERPRIM_LOCUS26530 [Linum perenne]